MAMSNCSPPSITSAKMSMSVVNWRDLARLRDLLNSPNSTELKLVSQTDTTNCVHSGRFGFCRTLTIGFGATGVFGSARSSTSRRASVAASAAAAFASRSRTTDVASLMDGLPG